MTALPVLLAVAVLATGKPAPRLSPDAPFSVPPPANLTRDEVLSWIAKYVRSGKEWALLAYDYEGVKLVGPAGVTRSGEGWAQADVRTELFKPIALRAGVTARSGLARWSVDCEAGRLAVRHMVVYAGNNLEGELATRETDEAIWQEPVGSEAEAIKSVCKAIGK
jgi:hypothetical protein